jgi:hypothetical protein
VTDFDPSAQDVLRELRTRYPETKFLALGQTVWWDEPMKAVLRLMLDRLGLGGAMVLGVHDTDYFAKAHLRHTANSRFELMAHNDGSTRDLWSAAGEISRLFGSETFPTRSDYNHYHVPFKQIVRNKETDPQSYLDDTTEAWGWRGLVYTGSRDLIVHRLPLADMGESVEQMLKWGFDGTNETLVDGCCREEARHLATRLLQMVADYQDANPGTYLSNLYRDIYPRLFELLLNSKPENIEVECTTHILRLTPETAHLPRFEFVDLFLNEKTRSLAARAYNEAVAGSEIYTLDRFGLGALPFDLVLPHHGRGTLRVTLRAIHIETRNPIRIPLAQPINSIHELAEVLTREFGDHVTLVGKAVALVSMLAREFLFVFNEEGSAYVTRTRQMNDTLQVNGVPLHMHPIVRVKYSTWDSLEVAGATLSLPDHLASTFGQRQIPAAEFAQKWRTVVDEQQAVLKTLEDITKPRALITYLANRLGDDWSDTLSEYESAKQEQRLLHDKAAELQGKVNGLYTKLSSIKQDIRDTEKSKGDHFRSVTDWTEEEKTKRAAFDSALIHLLTARRDCIASIAETKARRMDVERGESALDLRAQIDSIEARAGSARLNLVRNAILTCSGLTHTDHRPSAWWLPMVDRSGCWFERIAQTTKLYLQPLLSEAV